ncbi:tetratricopeptide repeat protein [Luteibacter sp. Lutesp34]|uniref:tetratricopeptide repeat protein n=1 Tax=Luteibacter sp. Lutesp34 TaxID=3243030 RepID=UPI0039B5385E
MMRSRSLLLALLLAPSVYAADSPKDVQALIARGDYAGAEAMLREAIAEHPQSAKAHYVLAEVLAHEGNVGEAKSEAAKAATLDPGTHFTDPAKFQAFRRKLDAALAPSSNLRASTPRLEDDQAAESRTAGRSHLLNLLAIGAGIALLVFLWMRRRRTDVPPAAYPPEPPPEGMPPYGASPGGAPYGAPPQPHSGVGTAVAAGLGGVAAGMLLDEALRARHGEDGLRDTGPVIREDGDPSAQAYDDLRDEPIDMGNNDSSWDDTGSAGATFDDDDSW